MSEASGIELSSLIGQLRWDIGKTWWEGQDSPVALEVGPIELEVTVQVEKGVDAKFGVKFWVVDAGAGGKATATNTQRIKLTLTPRDRRDPTLPLQIAAQAEPEEDIPNLGKATHAND